MTFKQVNSSLFVAVGMASALTATEAADQSPLLNVSYDLTRGLSQQFDAALINLNRSLTSPVGRIE